MTINLGLGPKSRLQNWTSTDKVVFRKPDIADSVRPAARGQDPWPRRERLGMIGVCLSGAFPPCDGDFDDLLLALGEQPARTEPGDSAA